MSKMPPTKEEALAVLKTCEGYENIVLQEDESGWLSGTHPNGCPVRIVGSDENGWFEVHGGICGKWLECGGSLGELGLPVSNEEDDSGYRDPNGKRSRFQHGAIHGWPVNPDQPKGAFDFKVEKYTRLNNSIPGSQEAEERLRSNDGWEQVQLTPFAPDPEEYWYERQGIGANGLPCRIIWSEITGCHEVHGGICDSWLNNHGGPAGHLGLPVADEDPCPKMGQEVRMSLFQRGCLWWSPKDRGFVQCGCAGKPIYLELSHNPLTIETTLLVNGRPCHDDWFQNVVGNEDAPLRLQMWIDRFYSAFRKAFSFAEAAVVKFRGVAFDCEDVQQIKLDAKSDHFPLELTTEECKSAEEKYKQLLDLYEEAQRLEYKPFEKVQELFRQIENRVFNIGVVGPMKNGKSTLLNAIIGQDLLPTQGQRCTAKICYIEHDPKAERFEAKLEEDTRTDSSTQSFGSKGFLPADPELLRHWNKDESNHRSFIVRGRLAKIVVPNNYKLTFVDTPGPDSAIYAADAEEVEHFFEEDRASMMFCVYNYSNQAQRESLKRVKAKLERFGRQIEDRMVFIVPRLDEKPIPEDATKENNPLGKEIQTIKADLYTFGFKTPKIILVSAKIALDVRQFPVMLKRAVQARRSANMGSLNRLQALIGERIKEFEVFCSQFERMGTTSMDISCISSAVRDPLIQDYNRLLCSSASKKYEALLRRCEILSGVPALEKCVEEYLVKYLIPARVHEAAEEFRGSIRLADLESRALERIQEDVNAKAKLDADLKKVEELESGETVGVLKKKIENHIGFPSSSFEQKRGAIFDTIETDLRKILKELEKSLSNEKDQIEVQRATELREWFEKEIRAVEKSQRSTAESALEDEANRFSEKAREWCKSALSDVLEGSQFLKELLQQQRAEHPQLNWTDCPIDLNSIVKEKKTTQPGTRTINRLREGVVGVFSYIFHGFKKMREEKVTVTTTEQIVPKKIFISHAENRITSVKKSFETELSDGNLDEILHPVATGFIQKVDGFFSDTSHLRENINMFTNKLKTTEQERAKHEAMLNRVRRLGDQLQSLLKLEPVTSTDIFA